MAPTDDPRITDPSTGIHDADHVDEEIQESRTSKLRSDLHAFYTRNFGLFLVFIAQTCGSVVCPLISFPFPHAQPPRGSWELEILTILTSVDEHSGQDPHG
jgi:hypothetical protein